MHSRLFVALLLLTLAGSAWSATGPRIPPCEGCPVSPTEFPYPRAGMWYDPARDGTGMNLEVQNGVVVGTWHGFNEDGRPMWYQFSGTLAPMPEDEEGYWQLEAPLAQFVGGNCIDCPYRPSEVAGVRGILRLKVIQRNLISYQIDGGEEYRMLPLVWGTPMPQSFPEVSDHGHPVAPPLEFVSPWAPTHGMTPWTLIRRTPEPLDTLYIGGVGAWWLSSRASSTATPYRMDFLTRLPTEWNQQASVKCGRLSEVDWGWTLPADLTTFLGDGPFCIMRHIIGTGTFKFYVAPLADIGDDYMRFTATDGSVIEAFRMLYR